MGKNGKPTERLHSSIELDRGEKLVDDDGVLINCPTQELVELYRNKVRSYLQQYGLRSQLAQLEEVANANRSM